MTDETKVSVNEDGEEALASTVSGGGFSNIEPGKYDAVVHGIVYLGLRDMSRFKKTNGDTQAPAPQVKIIVEIPDQLRGDETTTTLSTDVTLSVNTEKGNFAAIVGAILQPKKKLTNEDMADYMYPKGLKSLLGKAVSVSVTEWEREGKSGVTLDRKGFHPLDVRLPQPVPVRDAFFFSPTKPDIEIFEKTLTAWTRKQVMEAVNAAGFPDELKASWAKMQVEDAKAEAERKQPNKAAAASGSTNSIE